MCELSLTFEIRYIKCIHSWEYTLLSPKYSVTKRLIFYDKRISIIKFGNFATKSFDDRSLDN